MLWLTEKTFWSNRRDMRTYGNTWKIATGQQDGYAAFAGLYLFLQISTIKW